MAQITIQPDGTTGKDSWLDENNPTTNHGTAALLGIGYRSATSKISRGIFQFDLTGIPQGSTINSATFSIYATGTDEGESGNRTYEVHYVTQSWDESTVTWSNQPTFDATVEDSVVVTANTTGFKTFSSMATVVQEWLDGDQTNYGIVVKVNNETLAPSMNYATSDNATAANRPKLVVNYTPPPFKPIVMAVV